MGSPGGLAGILGGPLFGGLIGNRSTVKRKGVCLALVLKYG